MFIGCLRSGSGCGSGGSSGDGRQVARLRVRRRWVRHGSRNAAPRVPRGVSVGQRRRQRRLRSYGGRGRARAEQPDPSGPDGGPATDRGGSSVGTSTLVPNAPATTAARRGGPLEWRLVVRRLACSRHGVRVRQPVRVHGDGQHRRQTLQWQERRRRRAVHHGKQHQQQRRRVPGGAAAIGQRDGWQRWLCRGRIVVAAAAATAVQRHLLTGGSGRRRGLGAVTWRGDRLHSRAFGSSAQILGFWFWAYTTFDATMGWLFILVIVVDPRLKTWRQTLNFFFLIVLTGF